MEESSLTPCSESFLSSTLCRTHKPADRSNGYVQCPFEFILHKKSYYEKCKSKLRLCCAIIG